MGNTGSLSGSQSQFGSRHLLESMRPVTLLQHTALFLHCPLLLAFVQGHRALQTTHSPGPTSPGTFWPPTLTGFARDRKESKLPHTLFLKSHTRWNCPNSQPSWANVHHAHQPVLCLCPSLTAMVQKWVGGISSLTGAPGLCCGGASPCCTRVVVFSALLTLYKLLPAVSNCSAQLLC